MTTPKARTEKSSATAYQTVSCARMVRTSGLHDVPDPAHGVDEPGPASLVDLLAQPVDDDIHDVGARIKVVVPDVLGDQSAAHHAADRKSTRLNSSHGYISYAVFCLKKKKTQTQKNMPGSLRCHLQS